MLRKPRRQMNQINVVPYLDVMLVLLVIFMITAPLVNPGQIELPQVGHSLAQASLPIEITIKADHTLLIRDRATSPKDTEVTRNEIAKIVKEKQTKNPSQAVVIAADRSVRYEEVIGVMDILQQAQVKKIGLLAKSRKG
jgi:biopolymer transport protein TolR